MVIENTFDSNGNKYNKIIINYFKGSTATLESHDVIVQRIKRISFLRRIFLRVLAVQYTSYEYYIKNVSRIQVCTCTPK